MLLSKIIFDKSPKPARMMKSNIKGDDREYAVQDGQRALRIT